MGSVKEVIFPDDGPAFAKREDCMALDVVDGTHNRPQKWSTRPVKNLITEDISPPKRSFSVPPPATISSQKTYYPNPLRRPRDLSLTTGDILGAQSKRTLSKRRTDPIQPVYEFPGERSMMPVEPFVPRANIHSCVCFNRDIEKSYYRPKEWNFVRDPMDVSDIPYTSANYRNRHVRPYKFPGERKEPYVEPRKPAREYRRTNPLEPVYYVSQSPGSATLDARWTEEKDYNKHAPAPVALMLGPCPGSRPRKLHWSNGEPQLGLLTQDLPGAIPQRWIGELPWNMYQPRTSHSKPVLNTINHDIPGAQVGTLRTGLAKIRDTNPLCPSYRLLDGTVCSWKTGGGQAAASDIHPIRMTLS